MGTLSFMADRISRRSYDADLKRLPSVREEMSVDMQSMSPRDFIVKYRNEIAESIGIVGFNDVFNSPSESIGQFIRYAREHTWCFNLSYDKLNDVLDESRAYVVDKNQNRKYIRFVDIPYYESEGYVVNLEYCII